MPDSPPDEMTLLQETQGHIVALKNRDRQPHEQALLDYLMRVREGVEDLRAALEKIRFTEGVPRSIERIALAVLKSK